MSKKTTPKNQPPRAMIAQNRKARHEYSLETVLNAGLVLEGWEVKSLRAGKANISDGYVIIKGGEAWLLGSHITPLLSASTHIQADPFRTRKLLLKKREIASLSGAIERKGYTVVPLAMIWRNSHVKLDIAMAKGKKLYDKRQTLKDRDWQRNQQRALKYRE
jgi:SsrA-binding protein